MDIVEIDEDELLGDEPPHTDTISANPSINDVMRLLSSVASTTKATNKSIENYIAQNDKRVAAIEAKGEATDAKVDILTSKLVKFEGGMDSIHYTLEVQKQQQLKNNITISAVPTAETLDLIDIRVSKSLQSLEKPQQPHNSQICVVRLKSGFFGAFEIHTNKTFGYFHRL